MYRTIRKRIQPIASNNNNNNDNHNDTQDDNDDTDVPFDERINQKVVKKEPEMKSESLCRPRSIDLLALRQRQKQKQKQREGVAIARASTYNAESTYSPRRTRAGLISRTAAASNRDQTTPDLVPPETATTTTTTTLKTTVIYTPLPTRSETPKNKPDSTAQDDASNVVQENNDDSSSSSFCSNYTSDDDDYTSSFGSGVSSLSGVFADLQSSNYDDDTTKLLEDASHLQQEGETTLGDNTTQHDSMETDVSDDEDDNCDIHDEEYTSFRRNNNNANCRMMCFVDDASDSVGLEDFLDTDTNRHREKQQRHKSHWKKKQVTLEPEKPKSSLSYVCESLDCLGLWKGLCWGNEDATVGLTAEVEG
ncbi:unnamed protein product [Cylindrotheca closterium]|uniref:Uncharacterized protein n=1 Tax=Cylindrotheca closterium TaxID=2856 RepID=A0AAD2CQF2_9STRA|nr:unnamed protein product [Cylindrotheca closterium]